MDIQKQSEHLLQLMQILKLKTMINCTPLHLAAAIQGHTEAIRELIAAHANIEAHRR